MHIFWEKDLCLITIFVDREYVCIEAHEAAAEVLLQVDVGNLSRSKVEVSQLLILSGGGVR